jgi:hypothetical protein
MYIRMCYSTDTYRHVFSPTFSAASTATHPQNINRQGTGRTLTKKDEPKANCPTRCSIKQSNHKESMATPDASLLATKRIVYVGSLANEIKEELIRAAFIPFGSIKSVMMVSAWRTQVRVPWLAVFVSSLVLVQCEFVTVCLTFAYVLAHGLQRRCAPWLLLCRVSRGGGCRGSYL